MMKVVKWTVGAIATLVLLLAIVIAVISVRFDPNTYKTELTQAIYKTTGRHLKIEGELRLFYYPSLGVSAEKISLDNPPGFEPALFFQAKQVKVLLKLLPLLHGNFSVDEVILDSPQLALIRNSRGQVNWRFDQAEETSGASAKNPSLLSSEPSALTQALLDGTLSKLHIASGDIYWFDNSDQQQKELSNLDCDANNIQIGKWFPIDVHFNVNAGHSTLGAISSKGALKLSKALDQIEGNIQSLNLDLNDGKSGQSSTQTTLRGHLVYNKLANRILLEDLNISGQPMILTKGQALVEGTAQDYHATLSAMALNYQGTIFQNIKAQLTGTADQMIVTEARATLDGGTLEATGGVMRLKETPEMLVKIKISNVQAGALFDQYHVPVTGVFNGQLALSGEGSTEKAMVKTLKGQAHLQLTQGTLKAVNIGQVLQVADQLLHEAAPPQEEANGSGTSFSELGGDFSIAQGIANTNNLLMKSPLFQIAGNGQISLSQQQLNMKLLAQQVKQGGELSRGVPLILTGSFAHPILKPDTIKILEDQAKRQIERFKKGAFDESLQKLGPAGEQAKQVLSALFG